VETLSHNTAVFRFALPSDAHVSGMSVASCLLTKAELDVKNAKGEVEKQVVVRPYTPISVPEQTGFMDLLVKKYPNGPMSEHFFSLKPGQTLLFKGPIVKIAYEANKWRHVGMIAGGTGIVRTLEWEH
jgi:cytochrome-b5 reductase